jgi:hypothetical protein
MKKTFGKMSRSRIALEMGTHSPWVSRLLSDLGREATVTHIRSVRTIGQRRRKHGRMGGDPSRAAGIGLKLLHAYAPEDSATVLIQYSKGIHLVVDVRWNSNASRGQFSHHWNRR